jgi:putative selenate reductase molybdopterin-binding subunit
LFSEPQPAVTRLLDLGAFGWPSLVAGTNWLEIAATCTLAELYALRAPQWAATPLIRQCCNALLEPVKMYRCPNKRLDGWSVYTHPQPSGAFRGYGLSQAAFALESALDELARKLNIEPAEFRRRNMIRAGDPMIALGDDQVDVQIGSYSLDQCLDPVEEALASGRGEPAPAGPGWLTGTGIAASMLDSAPPGGHYAQARIAEQAGRGYTLCVGTAEFGKGTATAHRQLTAQVLDVGVADIELLQSDTDLVDHDTGAFGSAGTMVAGLATVRAAEALAKLVAARGSGQPVRTLLAAEASSDGTPRTVTFNVHGFRVALAAGHRRDPHHAERACR